MLICICVGLHFLLGTTSARVKLNNSRGKSQSFPPPPPPQHIQVVDNSLLTKFIKHDQASGIVYQDS